MPILRLTSELETEYNTHCSLSTHNSLDCILRFICIFFQIKLSYYFPNVTGFTNEKDVLFLFLT